MKDFFDIFTVERLFGTIFEINIFNSIAEKLSENLFSSSGKFGPMLGAVQSCYNMVYPIAVMLIFIYFIVAMIDKVASETFTPEQAWKTFALLLGTKVLIEHGFELIQLLFNIGLSISAQFANLRNSGADFVVTEEQIKELVENAKDNITFLPKFMRGFILWIAVCPLALIPNLMNLGVSVIVYSRIIEIYLRAVYMPVALADVFHGGLQSGGWRALRSFLAVSLQGATILVISIIYGQLAASMVNHYGATGEFWPFMGGTIAIQASALMLMFKSLNLTKEVLGVA